MDRQQETGNGNRVPGFAAVSHMTAEKNINLSMEQKDCQKGAGKERVENTAGVQLQIREEEWGRCQGPDRSGPGQRRWQPRRGTGFLDRTLLEFSSLDGGCGRRWRGW